MFRQLSLPALVALAVLAGTPADARDMGDFQIDPDRVPDFYPPPEIPDTTLWAQFDVTSSADMGQLNCGTANPGNNANDTNAIDCAINNAPDNSIIYVPPGVYNWPDRETIHIEKSNRVLRCESPSTTKFLFGGSTDEGDNVGRCGNRGGFVQMCSNVDEYGSVSWTGGHNAGTKNITVSDGSSFSTGDWVLLAQNNDPNKADFPLSSGDYWRQIVKVESRNGNSITLDRKVRTDFDHSNRKVYHMDMVENIGVENCMFDNTFTNANKRARPVNLSRVANSWVTGNHFHNWPQVALQVKLAARNVVRGNTFKDSPKSGAGPQQMYLLSGASDNVFENNIFDDADPIKIEQGANGNVIAYNFFLNGDTRAVFFHGTYPHENLVEGNHMANRSITADNRWGRQGPRNTVYRNRLVQRKQCWKPSGGGKGTWGGFCTSDSQCNSGYTCNERQSGAINTHADKGAQQMIWPDANILANASPTMHMRPFCGQGPADDCKAFDFGSSSPGLHLENNRTRHRLWLADRPTTTAINNLENAPTKPSNWDGFDGPDSLYMDGPPSWWCAEACPFSLHGGIGAFGDDITPGSEDQLCKIPAKILYDGGQCTPVGIFLY